MRQLDLKEAAAALQAVQSHVVQTRLNVRLVGVEGLMENVLHHLDNQSKKKKGNIFKCVNVEQQMKKHSQQQGCVQVFTYNTTHSKFSLSSN